MKLMQTNSGFTMTELLVVVSIITIIIVGASVGGVRVLERAQAQKMVSDFKEIETAWLTWQSDTHQQFPPENTTGYTMSPACAASGNHSSLISTSHLYNRDPDGGGIDPTQFDSDLWNGPYLDRVLTDPYGREYKLDNDSNNTYNSSICTSGGSNLYAGVNISRDWCNETGNNYSGDYLRLVNHINAIVDGNEGNDARRCGKFRWVLLNSWGGRMYYMIEDND